MLNILTCIRGEHDLSLVLLAAMTCGLGATALFLLLKRSRECPAPRWGSWCALAALAAGIGTWATHFLAMLAYDAGVVPGYDPGLTVLSVVMCVAMFWAATRAMDRRPGLARAALAGFFAACGVGTMHFLGMAALQVPALVFYDTQAIFAGVGVAFALFVAGFAAFDRMGGWRQVCIPACLSVLAVVVLHFNAMAATTVLPDAQALQPARSLSREWLSVAVASVSLTLIVLIAVGALVDRYLTDLRGFAEATLEGIAILNGEIIVEVNAQFANLVKVPADMLVGARLAQWLELEDGGNLAEARDGYFEVFPVGERGGRIFEANTRRVEFRGRESLVLAINDLTEKKRAIGEIEFMARHDALTGLANRAAMDEWIDEAIGKGRTCALFTLDLDRFKAINDVFGHAAGDEILCLTADILRETCHRSTRIARMGGDEFMILLTGRTRVATARDLAGELLGEFRHRMDITRDPMAAGVSIGVAMHPNDAQTPDELRAAADIALYRAKAKGKGQVCFFDGEMDAAVRARRKLEQELRHALIRGQFTLAYQPQVNTATRRIVGYEALLRWQHPELGDIPPDSFICVAEDTGTIMEIGEWVIREACREAAGWPGELTIAVNVSPVQFHSPDLPNIVARALADNRLDPHQFEIEITESVILDDRPFALKTLRTLKNMGVRVTIDDFGTGYSSLGNLMNFPFDKIKIDRSFVAAIEDDEAALSIVRAILGLGRNLSLPVVAEGVETDRQHAMITQEGCEQAQGYLFGRPAPGTTSLNNDKGEDAPAVNSM